jgi:hypothetical protein
MTDTLNKPVKDEVGDERGATKHNQGPSKYDKETNIAGRRVSPGPAILQSTKGRATVKQVDISIVR